MFVAVFALLHVIPLIHVQKQEVKSEKTCENTCAAKSKCSKQEPAEEKKDCDNNEGCNPFVPCSMGSCCYVTENFYEHALFANHKRQKNVLVNDNTLQTALSECWQPPETRS
jgi:hypothetical protein